MWGGGGGGLCGMRSRGRGDWAAIPAGLPVPSPDRNGVAV